MSTPTIAAEQQNVRAAQSHYESAKRGAAADIAAIPFPADYDGNDAAALAYEEAVAAIETEWRVDHLRRACRAAEDALIDRVMAACSTVPDFAKVKGLVPALRASAKHRGTLIDACLRLAP